MGLFEIFVRKQDYETCSSLFILKNSYSIKEITVCLEIDQEINQRVKAQRSYKLQLLLFSKVHAIDKGLETETAESDFKNETFYG